MCDVRTARTPDLQAPGEARSFLLEAAGPRRASAVDDVVDVLAELLRSVDGEQPVAVSVVVGCDARSVRLLVRNPPH